MEINKNIYNDINLIKPHKNMMFWCTCAQYNQKQYLKRIYAWRKQLETFNINADIYVFNDGKIIQDINNYAFTDINFVCFDKPLGRQSIWIFPGFKRSLYYAMILSLKYDYCIHLQNDSYVQKKEVFLKNLQSNNICAYAYNVNYNFAQLTCTILNNKQVRQSIIKRYQNNQNFYQNCNFQFQLSKIIPCYISLGKSFRMQYPIENYQDFDILAQCDYNYILNRL